MFDIYVNVLRKKWVRSGSICNRLTEGYIVGIGSN